MAEMVEPDRTIMIVSIIGLVIIWGSFFYHKYVQGGGNGKVEEGGEKDENGLVAEGEAVAVDGVEDEIDEACSGFRRQTVAVEDGPQQGRPIS